MRMDVTNEIRDFIFTFHDNFGVDIVTNNVFEIVKIQLFSNSVVEKSNASLVKFDQIVLVLKSHFIKYLISFWR